MPERGDPARRLAALRSSSPPGRTGWVAPPPEPVDRRRRVRGAHRAGGYPDDARRTGVEDRPGNSAEDPPVAGYDDAQHDPPGDMAGADPDPGVAVSAVAGPWGRWAERWVPDSLREARIDPGRRGAVLLTVIAAVAAVVAAVGVWRDRPEPRPVQPVALAPGTTQASPTIGPAEAQVSGAGRSPPDPTTEARPPVTAVPTTPGSAVVHVSVTGLVRKPGLVRLPAGSRVADAIEAAGGVAEAGDITGLNLAAPLADGDSVVVGGGAASTVRGTLSGPADRSGAGNPPAGPTGTGVAAPVDLNTADQAALESLPGVGPVMASNILAWRSAHGSFSSVEQLQEVSGIGPSRYAQLAPLVTV